MAIVFKEKATWQRPFKIDKIVQILIIVIVILLFACLTLWLYKASISGSIKDVQNKIQEINKKRDVALEKEMKSSLEKFDKAKTLLVSHKNAKGIFTFLEQNIYEGVVFSNFEANLKENTLSFNISSSSPQNLAVQIAAFKNASLGNNQKAVSNIEVGGFSVDEKGTVTLHLKLTFDPTVTKF